ncbi:choice-of-anchor D domain-containing protein [Bernardetia sp. ABR2-2B]|uniref:choice-of-anchor D domain-containing protein n=1 Tax=Bernardetia sp. ABR2-2B TaxID=3127472 RepID=UPI0030D41361
MALDGLFLGNLSTEINIQGNGIDIANGDTTPDLNDGTDFGSVCSSNTQTNIFTIQNTGVSTLDLTGLPLVTISGSPDFSISAQPSTNTITSGTDITFEVTYTPNITGLQVATVSLASNDSDENPYTFDVSASYTVDTTPPVISVPTNIVVDVDAGSCGAVVNYKVCTTDNCEVVGSDIVLEFTGSDVFGTPYIEQGMTITSPNHVDAPWSVSCGDGRGILIHAGDLSNLRFVQPIKAEFMLVQIISPHSSIV